VPRPSYKDLRRFCELDGWEETFSARGKTPDHHRYKKVLRNGEILRTKVSHGNGSVQSPALWNQIYKKQLALSDEQEFWDVLKTGEPVARRGDEEPAPPPAKTLPEDLAWALIARVGLSEAEVLGMTREEAIERMRRHWAGGS